MQIDPFSIAVPEEALDDLRRRLDSTRWAQDFSNDDWGYGTNGAYLKELADFWRNGYDWRAQEIALNRFRHFTVPVSGISLHYIHELGEGPAPLPEAAA